MVKQSMLLVLGCPRAAPASSLTSCGAVASFIAVMCSSNAPRVQDKSLFAALALPSTKKKGSGQQGHGQWGQGGAGQDDFSCQHQFAEPDAAGQELCRGGTGREPHPVICPAGKRLQANAGRWETEVCSASEISFVGVFHSPFSSEAVLLLWGGSTPGPHTPLLVGV